MPVPTGSLGAPAARRRARASARLGPLVLSVLIAAHAIGTALAQKPGPGKRAAPDPPASAPLREILLSRQVLREAGLAVGDEVLVSTSPDGARAEPFRIAGAYEPMADPMKLTAPRREARLHLPDLIALTADPRDPQAAEAVTAINLALRDPADAERFASDLAARMPGLVAVPVDRPPPGGDPFAVLERFHLAIALVTVIGSSAFLMALMVMRAEERRETVGILRLIGFSRRRILVEVLLEGLAIAAAGALFGILFAAATQGAVNRFFQWKYDAPLVFVRVTPGVALRCVALAIPLGVLAGLVASWSLLRREIVALVRR